VQRQRLLTRRGREERAGRAELRGCTRGAPQARDTFKLEEGRPTPGQLRVNLEVHTQVQRPSACGRARPWTWGGTGDAATRSRVRTWALQGPQARRPAGPGRCGALRRARPVAVCCR
jgi:hypothetical protein